MSERIRRLNAKQVEKILMKYGFELAKKEVIRSGVTQKEIFK